MVGWRGTINETNGVVTWQQKDYEAVTDILRDPFNNPLKQKYQTLGRKTMLGKTRARSRALKRSNALAGVAAVKKFKAEWMEDHPIIKLKEDPTIALEKDAMAEEDVDVGKNDDAKALGDEGVDQTLLHALADAMMDSKGGGKGKSEDANTLGYETESVDMNDDAQTLGYETESVDKNEDVMDSEGGDVGNGNPPASEDGDVDTNTDANALGDENDSKDYLALGDVDLGGGFVEEDDGFGFHYVSENGERTFLG